MQDRSTPLATLLQYPLPRHLLLLLTAPIGTGSLAVTTSSEEMVRVRVMMKVSVPVEAGNEAIRSGTFGEVMGSVLQSLSPEAVYCIADQGQRAALIFFDLKSPEQIPVVAEPLFQGFKATIDLTPCMTLEEVQSGLAQLQGTT